MACMEHVCLQEETCGWWVVNNESYERCPKCSGPIQSYFDEEGDCCGDERLKEYEE